MVTTTPEERGLVAHDLSRPVEKLPAWVWVLSIVLLILPMGFYGIVHDFDASAINLALILWFVVFIVLHELVHAIGWKFASGLPWSQFKFGFLWQSLSPYCHAKAPMNVVAYRIGAVMPLLVTGILPWLVALVLADSMLAIVGTVLISAAVGDLYILWTLRKVPDKAEVEDHPSQAGCIVYLPPGQTL